MDWIYWAANCVGAAAATSASAVIEHAPAVSTSIVHGTVHSLQYVASSASAVVAKMPEGTGKVLGCATVGAAAVPLTGVAAAALVPTAMSAFATVVPGIGSFHAVGGVAWTLQLAGTTLTTTSAAVAGAGVGVGGSQAAKWFGY